MSTEPKNEELPIGYANACELLEKKNGSRCNRSMRYRLTNVRGVYVEERFSSGLVRNPAKQGFWGFLQSDYIRGSVRELSTVYINGEGHGRLHGGSESCARAIQQMLSAPGQKSIDLIVSGHFTESGWFVDDIKVYGSS
ncbi:MAG: hypothetical protein SGJ27_20645 [Candidatus Melainabacteria bacterium]|nr:hypothetical protein [Candidatus Melainabacteria bacterium]